MERGYVKLWRKTLDSKHTSMGLKHIGLFDLMLLKANWKEGWFKGEKIMPGQFATSITGLAELAGEARHTIRNILNDLEQCGMVSRTNMNNRWVMVTITNWEEYQSQSCSTDSESLFNQSSTDVVEGAIVEGDKHSDFVQPIKNPCSTTVHSLSTIKEGKEGKNTNTMRVSQCPHGEMQNYWNTLCDSSGLRRCRTAWPTKEALSLWKNEWFRDGWKHIMEMAHKNSWCIENRIDVMHVMRKKNAAKYNDEYLDRGPRPQPKLFIVNGEN